MEIENINNDLTYIIKWKYTGFIIKYTQLVFYYELRGCQSNDGIILKNSYFLLKQNMKILCSLRFEYKTRVIIG